MENFDIVKYLKENHLGPHSILGGYVDLHALKEAEVGNNSIDPATLSAIDSWVKKNYPTARTPNPNEASLELDWASGIDSLKAKCKKHELTWEVVKEFGPAGGNPLVKIIGSKDNIISFLKDGYADADQMEDFVADIKQNSEVEDVEYYLGTDYIKLYKIEPNDPRQDVDDEDTTIAFINVTRDEDGNIIYYEVRDSIDYPGDYEQGEGNYGEPNGVWNSKTKEFIYDGYSSDDEDAEEFMEAEDLEGWKMVKKLAANDKRVAAAFLKPLVTVYGEDNVKIVKQGEVYKIYTKGKEELNNEADYGNNEPVDEVPYVGAQKKLDGFGDEFDQVAPVEEAMTAWEEKLNYYESEVNDLVYDMMETTGANPDQIADFFQYISTQIRNKGNFGSMEEEGIVSSYGIDEENLAEVMDEENPWIKNELQKNMGAWRVFSDDGEVYWESETVPGKSIYATPGLYGKNGIVLQVKDSDMGNIGKEIVVKGTKGSYKKYSEYVADMKPILDKIQAQYKK
jgi:hypothetical protein